MLSQPWGKAISPRVPCRVLTAQLPQERKTASVTAVRSTVPDRRFLGFRTFSSR